MKRLHHMGAWPMVWLVCLLLLPAVSVSASEKGEQLRRVMADISLLNGQLTQRKADAARLRHELGDYLETIGSEVRQLVRDKKVVSEALAMQTPRIVFNLKLMAEIQAYMQRYAQKISYYRVACDRLSYLYQQADDDLKIVNTLSGMKIDALISQVQKVLDDYLPHAQTLVIEPETILFDPPQKVWRTLYAAR